MERGKRAPGAALVCGQKLLFLHKTPLSRTILLEWLRKMPNRGTLGIAVSSAAVSSDRGKNSIATLGLDRFRPVALAAAVRLCGEIVAALSLPCPCPCSLYIAIVLRGARALFFEGVRVYSECAEKGERQLARREKRQKSRKRKNEREREREREREGKGREGKKRISVISVDNVVYAASKRNDATFAK